MSQSSPVPPAVRAASEWAWRLLLIATAVGLLFFALSHLSEVVIPIVVATLLAALLAPVHRRLRSMVPSGAAAGLTVLATVIVIGGLLTLVASQFTGGFADMAQQVGGGIAQIRDWLRTTFRISDTQFTEYVDQLKETVTSSGDLRSAATKAGLTATHAVAGMFISLFALFFFLYEGQVIWGWVVRLFPRSARRRVDSSGHIAWGQLTSFVRATIIVAFVDALGITLGAVVLRVPFAGAIGVLVFLGAFIPIVGALLSGSVAVLLALVANGPVSALLMLGVVVLVQQIESHVLQPFLLGRAVRVHPLAVILAIATGVILAGIVGALVAVPAAAVLNAVGRHLLADEVAEADQPTEDPQADEPDEPGDRVGAGDGQADDDATAPNPA
ncbi:MAG: AI-2E family transporter [Lapillicoccus sp.]